MRNTIMGVGVVITALAVICGLMLMGKLGFAAGLIVALLGAGNGLLLVGMGFLVGASEDMSATVIQIMTDLKKLNNRMEKDND